MDDLRSQAELSSKKLDELAQNQIDAFGRVEDDSLTDGNSDQEKNAFRFFKALIDTLSGVIGEFKKVFGMCVTYHASSRVETDSIKRDVAELREDVDKLLGVYGVIKVLWSGRALIVAALSTVAVVAYRSYFGE